MTHRRTSTVLAAAILIAVGTALAPTVPALVDRLAPATLGEMAAPGFLLALLVSWALGSLIFTSRRRRT
jgi:hypothetical protein